MTLKISCTLSLSLEVANYKCVTFDVSKHVLTVRRQNCQATNQPLTRLAPSRFPSKSSATTGNHKPHSLQKNHSKTI